jgi:hypothetical protein
MPRRETLNTPEVVGLRLDRVEKPARSQLESLQHVFPTSGSELSRVTCVLDGDPARE